MLNFFEIENACASNNIKPKQFGKKKIIINSNVGCNLLASIIMRL
jgi:hypothetical protein